MATNRVLFVEGEPETQSGNLRQGFEKLLRKRLTNPPRIKLGGSKMSTIDQFKNNRMDAEAFLLCDLDAPADLRTSDIVQNGLKAESERVFYMIQEMESWFLSQPDVLDKYYGKTKSGKRVSERLVQRNSQDIPDPKEEMKRLTRDLNKGEPYHVIKHAVDLLPLLDPDKLETSFPDFKGLIDKLNSR